MKREARTPFPEKKGKEGGVMTQLEMRPGILPPEREDLAR